MLELIWVTRDGRRYPVSKMSTEHIANAIAMIRRGKGWRREYLPRLELELEIRGIK